MLNPNEILVFYVMYTILLYLKVGSLQYFINKLPNLDYIVYESQKHFMPSIHNTTLSAEIETINEVIILFLKSRCKKTEINNAFGHKI